MTVTAAKGAPPALEDTARSSPDVGGVRHTRRLVVGTAAVVGFVVLVAVLYVAARHAFSGDSDGATVVLQGQAMGSGNLTLHGWSLSLDSFWTVDAVAYMLVEAVTGVQGTLLYLVPAVIAASVIVVGVFLACDGQRGIAAFASGATVVLLLALPSHELANVFLRGPLHVGTALLCLCAFAGLRSGRFGWGWIVAVLCLAAGILGDFQTAVLGVGSVCAAGFAAMLRRRDWRTGVRELGAGIVALALAVVVRLITDAVGTFSVNVSHPRASGSQMITNVGHLPSWFANLLGVGGGQLGNGGTPVALGLVHLVGLLVVAGGCLAGTVALVSGVIGGTSSENSTTAWRLDDLLVLAVCADVVLFLVLTTSDDPGFLRYLTAAVIFATVLAGRWVGYLVAGFPTTSRRARRAAAVVGLAVVAALTTGFGFTLAAPVPVQQSAQLGRFLEGRQLVLGIGDYWSASITTVATSGTVTVRPVIATPTGQVVRYQRQSDEAWYSNQPFQFLVYDTARRWGGIGRVSAAQTFGPVARTYAVGPYRVLVWRHPVHVSTRGWPVH